MEASWYSRKFSEEIIVEIHVGIFGELDDYRPKSPVKALKEDRKELVKKTLEDSHEESQNESRKQYR